MNDYCRHPQQEVWQRIDVSGRRFYQRQCLACGTGVGSAIAASIALADGQTPPFDESIEAKWGLEADRLREKRWRMRKQAYAEYLESDAWRTRRSHATEAFARAVSRGGRRKFIISPTSTSATNCCSNSFLFATTAMSGFTRVRSP
jgi:hypothetical protein